MDQYIYCVFVLKNYLRNIFGHHIPYEIIQIIIMSIYSKISISCGWRCTFLISDSNVYAWGNNFNGQLGLGHNQSCNVPQKFNLNDVKKISCGASHTMALTYSNDI